MSKTTTADKRRSKRGAPDAHELNSNIGLNVGLLFWL